MKIETMIDLSPFCDPKRDKMNTPWAHGDYTYASDGIIGLRVARRDDVVRTDGPDFQSLIDKAGPARNLQPLPDLSFPTTAPTEGPCPDCNGVGYIEKCRECDGTGCVECCECGHESDCTLCKGEGSKKVARIGGTHRIEFDDGGIGLVMPAWPPGSSGVYPDDAMIVRLPEALMTKEIA